MKTLTTLLQITPSQASKLYQWPQSHQQLHPNLHGTPLQPERSWRLYSRAKGFSGNPKNRELLKIERRGGNDNNDDDDDDDKIPEVVFERMIKRILFYVGVPLAIGFVFLQAFSVMKERELWDVPIWLPYLTTLITFGASALGIAFGSLSTSLDEEKDGSFLGFEQVEKNWVEMWKEEDEGSDSEVDQIKEPERWSFTVKRSWRLYSIAKGFYILTLALA